MTEIKPCYAFMEAAEKEQVLNAARVIKHWCDYNSCDWCPFWRKDLKEKVCELQGQRPMAWQIPGGYYDEEAEKNEHLKNSD